MINNKLENSSELFLKYDYPETKDMCKHFLTLSSSILAITLTFSDKIVNFVGATNMTKWLVALALVILLLSIIACGIGLLLITVAAGKAVYEQKNYSQIAQKSYRCIILAGILFIMGLLFLIITTILKIAL